MKKTRTYTLETDDLHSDLMHTKIKTCNTTVSQRHILLFHCIKHSGYFIGKLYCFKYLKDIHRNKWFSIWEGKALLTHCHATLKNLACLLQIRKAMLDRVVLNRKRLHNKKTMLFYFVALIDPLSTVANVTAVLQVCNKTKIKW